MDNLMQHRLVAFAREQAVTTQQNVRLSIHDTPAKQEPDVVFYFSPKALETDVTVVNPCAPSKLMHTISKPGSALRSRCEDKNRKYLDQARLRAMISPRSASKPMGALANTSFACSPNWQATRQTTLDSVAEMSLDLSLTLVRGN